MGVLDNQANNNIRTIKLVYLEYLLLGAYFILFNLFVIRVYFSGLTFSDLLSLVFFTIFIPVTIVLGWRRKLIRYQEKEINIDVLMENFWSSRLAYVALVLFIDSSLLYGIIYKDLPPNICRPNTDLFRLQYYFVLAQLVYAIVTRLLIKKINEG